MLIHLIHHSQMNGMHVKPFDLTHIADTHTLTHRHRLFGGYGALAVCWFWKAIRLKHPQLATSSLKILYYHKNKRKPITACRRVFNACARKAVSTTNHILESRVRCIRLLPLEPWLCKWGIMKYFCTRRYYYYNVCNKNKFPIACISSQLQTHTRTSIGQRRGVWLRMLCINLKIVRMNNPLFHSFTWLNAHMQQAMCTNIL